MDEELAHFLRPDETAAQLLARTYVQPMWTGLPLIDRFISFRGGQVLEIASAAGGGRTTALLQVAATCILPEKLDGVQYGGRAANVLFLDLDGKLDVLRLLNMLLARVHRAQLDAGMQPDEDPVLHSCMSRFHLVRCHSSFDLLAVLRTLQPALDGLAASPAGLACILIDNVAAYYYLDKVARGAPAGRADGALQRGGAAGAGVDLMRQGAPLTLYRVHSAMAAALRAIQQQYRVPIIATKHLVLAGGAAREADKQDGWPHREVMLKPWQDLVTHRLLLRAEADGGSGGGGKGGGSGSSRAGGGAAEVVRLARWQSPEDPAVIQFDIDDAGIHLQ